MIDIIGIFDKATLKLSSSIIIDEGHATIKYHYNHWDQRLDDFLEFINSKELRLPFTKSEDGEIFYGFSMIKLNDPQAKVAVLYELRNLGFIASHLNPFVESILLALNSNETDPDLRKDYLGDILAMPESEAKGLMDTMQKFVKSKEL